MLSSVLWSERAVQVNIEIMRAFVRLRQLLASHEDLERRLDELERKYDEQFKVVFEAIWQLMAPPTRTQRLGLSGDRRQGNLKHSGISQGKTAGKRSPAVSGN